MKIPVISIIVPIYNVESYLSECIQSLINQSLKEIEIILINDGSTDSSKEIIENFRKQDGRIIVIESKNEGQGKARNKGIKIAKGDYIGFVDGDDFVDSDLYHLMYTSAIKDNLDMVVCGRRAITEAKKINRVNNVGNEHISIDNEISRESYVRDRLFYGHTVSVCNKLYRASILKKNNLEFRDVRKVGSEDLLFNINFIYHCNKIGETSDVFYNNVERIGSTTRAYNTGYFKRLSNLIQEMNLIDKKYEISSRGSNTINLAVLFYFQWELSQIRNYGDKRQSIIIIEELNSITGDLLFNNYMKKIILNKKICSDLKKMGYKSRGVMFLKLVLGCIVFKQYKIARKLICYF